MREIMAHSLTKVAAAVAEQCGTVVSAAVNAENTARDKWAKAGKALFKAGATVEALTKGTGDEPNPQRDDSLIETVESMIVDALTACVKPMKFDGETYTVGSLLALTRDELRDADNKVLSQTRRYWQQQVGSLFGLVRRYVDRVQNPDKIRGKKEKKTVASEPSTMRGDTLEGARLMLQALLAGKAKVVSTAVIDRYENALTEALALLSVK